jgi:hypothetical protein
LRHLNECEVPKDGRSEIEGIDFGGRDVVDSRGSKETETTDEKVQGAGAGAGAVLVLGRLRLKLLRPSR